MTTDAQIPEDVQVIARAEAKRSCWNDIENRAGHIERAIMAYLATRPIAREERPEQTATRDQMAAVMLARGSPEQMAQALVYAGAIPPRPIASGDAGLRERIIEILTDVLGEDDKAHIADKWRDEIDRLAALAATPALASVDGPACEDCRLPYSEPGFADLVVSHEAWEKMMPGREGGGLLCPTCMCRRAAAVGIETQAVFRSGAFTAPDTPALAPGGEPVAWQILLDGEPLDYFEESDRGILLKGYTRRPLFLHPAPAETPAAGWRDIASAPRDGTHILGFIRDKPDDYGYPGFSEWREVWWDEAVDQFLGLRTTWRAGPPDHDGTEGGERYGESLLVAWMPLPAAPLRDDGGRDGL